MDSRDDVNVTNDDMGCAFIDLTTIWKQINQTSNDSLIDASARVFLFDECEDLFDQHGEAEKNMDGEEVRNSVLKHYVSHVSSVQLNHSTFLSI